MLRPEYAGIDGLSELPASIMTSTSSPRTRAARSDRFGTSEQLQVLSGAIVAKLGALEETIMDVGRQTFAESPKALAARYEAIGPACPITTAQRRAE